MSRVKVYTKADLLQSEIERLKSTGISIGFVPTMGALHEGHLNLVRRASNENECVVVSIFVNPTQFNNSSDLEAYPRMLESDLEVLSALGIQVLVFAPDVHEIYPESDAFESIDLLGLEDVLEGTFRPGHFQGVVHVVRNLFRIVNPHRAYFGRKDLQQLAVIRRMTSYFAFETEIVACDTLRETSGLAMSSRNLRLSEDQKSDALIIFRTLQLVKEWSANYSPAEVRSKAVAFFNTGKLKLEYLEIIDDLTFKVLSDSWAEASSCCIAAYCGEVRLIDNLPCK